MGEHSGAIPELTEETFAAETGGPGWCLVDFYASWCPHCRAFRPVYEEVAGQYQGAAKLVAADVDQCRQAAERFGIRSIPTLVLLKDGEKLDIHVGVMSAQQLSEWLAEKVAG